MRYSGDYKILRLKLDLLYASHVLLPAKLSSPRKLIAPPKVQPMHFLWLIKPGFYLQVSFPAN